MSRALFAARSLILPRRIVLPAWLKGRASLYFDPTDNFLAGTIPADITGAGAWTILVRLRPATFHTATDRGAVSFGTNAAAQGAFLGQVISGSKPYIGGGLIGTTLADSRVASPSEWSDCMVRYAGGAGGALTLVVNGRSTSGVATGNITGTTASLGRLLVAGTCFGGRVSDAQVFSRAITDAEYDAWRLGFALPATRRRHWTCENPGYGTTCHEEIGNTEDAITGATWSPVVPFRRRRMVEDVPSCTKFALMPTLDVASHADINAGVGSFGVMGWFRLTGSEQQSVCGKLTGWPLAGWWLQRSSLGILGIYVGDGVHSASVNVTGRVGNNEWRHCAICVDRATNILSIQMEASVPRRVSCAAVGSVDSANPLQFCSNFGLSPAITGQHSGWVWRKGSPFSWDEIEAHYYDGKVPAGATCHWPMTEGAGTSVADVIGGRNGTLSAASWTTSTRSKARAAA